MKLIYKILRRLSIALLALMSLWGTIFYYKMVDEINDEADETLEDYSTYIVTGILAGELDPDNIFDTNDIDDRYSIMEVDSSYAAVHRKMRYYDTELFVPEYNEHESARVLATIFKDGQGKYYEMKIAIPSIEKDDLSFSVFIWTVTLYLLLMIVVLAITTFIFYRSLKPLYKLLGWLDSYIPGSENGEIVNDTTVAEFRKLNIAVQSAMKRSEEVYRRQKEFIGNASHELQTPLAVLSSRIDWLLDNTELTEEQMGELFKMKRTIGSVSRTNESLLLLSKIENSQFTDSADVDLVGVIEEYRQTYEEIYSTKNISLKLDLPEHFIVNMDKSLSSVLISNLIKNAFLHTVNGGTIEVSVQKRMIVIENDGHESIDEKQIFSRYYKNAERGQVNTNSPLEQPLASEKKSNGLGLAIIKAICTYYNLEIRYKFYGGRHHFALLFPNK